MGVADWLELCLHMMMETYLQALLPLRAFIGNISPVLVVCGIGKLPINAEVSWWENQGVGFLHITRKANRVQAIWVSKSGSLIRRVDGARWRALA